MRKKKKTPLFFLAIFLIIVGLIIILDKTFVLFSPPLVISTTPKLGTEDILLDSTLTINFDKPIKRQEIEKILSPAMHGEWIFQNPTINNHLFKTLVFVPAVNFEPDNWYQLTLKNIRGFGFKKTTNFQLSFKTVSLPKLINNDLKLIETEEPRITIIDIANDWQDDALSCEAASLKMALSAHEISVSENDIMNKIGYDLTPRKGNVWGDPYEKYVGDINGSMCKTGFGVYWGPVERAAQDWRPTESFSFWGIEELVKEIKNNNPIIFWGVLPGKDLVDCSWWTDDGKYIKAFQQTHVRLIIGFVGPANNPQKIIINDPISGRLYWETEYFLENWKNYDFSGVVVR